METIKTENRTLGKNRNGFHRALHKCPNTFDLINRPILNAKHWSPLTKLIKHSTVSSWLEKLLSFALWPSSESVQFPPPPQTQALDFPVPTPSYSYPNSLTACTRRRSLGSSSDTAGTQSCSEDKRLFLQPKTQHELNYHHHQISSLRCQIISAVC